MELESKNQEIFQKEVQLGEETQDFKEALIRPYKSIGVFADDNTFQVYSIAQQSYLLSSTRNAFKLYKLPQLKIQLLSPTFPNKIRAMCAINEYIFVGVKNTIYKMRYYHLISKIELASKVQKMLVLGKFLITLSEGGIITVIEHNSNLIVHTIFTSNSEQNQYENKQLTDIVHPPTYLNKLVAYGPYQMQIWNIATKKLIFSFEDSFLEDFIENKIQITLVECSPVLDVVAVAFSDGKIYLVDIRENKVLFKVQCQLPAVSLSFSKQDPPLLACGDEKGNIIIWDLNERKKFSVLKEVHSGCVNSLFFMYDEQMLLSGSGQGNEIYQWKFEEYSDSKFILFRKRTGLKSNITKLRCMDKDHVLACTNHKQTELREFSLKNECMSQFYSVKQQSQKQMKNAHILTETTIEQNKPVKDFAFSMNRSKDWANVITIHDDTTKPSLFNSEDKTIVKKKVELFRADDNTEKDSEITAAFVTDCGNYGVLGFESGKIIKFNLQSGKLQTQFKSETHKTTITSVFVNYCNKFLVSSDSQQNMIFWDFFSGQVLFQQNFENNAILFTRPAKFMDNFLIALTDCTLEIWDLNTQKFGRKFAGHTNKITDACWVSSNKQIISSGMDGLLNIYDILSNQLIQSIQIKNNKYYITSLDTYDDILVTAFNNSRQVFLWHNLIDSLFWNSGNKTKTIEFKSLLKYYSNSRTHFYLSNQIKNEEIEKTEDMELELNIIEDEDNSLIRFTKLESGKWLPLVNIEEIKERNQLENKEKEEIKMPFFLDFENKDKVKEQMRQEVKEKLQEKSKIMTQDKEKYLIELDQGLEQIFIKYEKFKIINGTHKDLVKISEEFLEFLSNLNYTQVDYEMRRFLFGNLDNVKMLVQVFSVLFDSQQQLDLKGVYFNNFIKISSYDLINLPELLEKMQEIQTKMKQQQQKMDNRINYIKCLAENFAKIPN